MLQRQDKDVTAVAGVVLINGEPLDINGYLQHHRRRIAFTIEKLRKMGAVKIVEVGSHPWAMTAQLVDERYLDICATISAEEMTSWPDDIGVRAEPFHIKSSLGNEARFVNYSANIERTLFSLEQHPDTVIACEIVEHLIRSPHIMFLNINHWLPISGKLFVTTPNGAQFANPFRRKSPTPGYRYHAYERHSYLYTLDQLTDVIQLCGFRVLEAGYCDLYERNGPSIVYGLLSKIPSSYFQEKFTKTIYVVSEKVKDVRELERPPLVCDPRGEWEFVRTRT